jgi:hypothetical protein
VRLRHPEDHVARAEQLDLSLIRVPAGVAGADEGAGTVQSVFEDFVVA